MISVAWTIGVIAEIAFFAYFRRVEKKVSLEEILTVSLILTVVRWVILASVTNTTVILISQALHAFTFGGVYVASMRLVPKLLPSEQHDRGQGYLVTFGSGLGSLVGRLSAGWGAMFLASYLGVQQLFVFSALLALLAVVAAYSLSTRTSVLKLGNTSA